MSRVEPVYKGDQSAASLLKEVLERQRLRLAGFRLLQYQPEVALDQLLSLSLAHLGSRLLRQQPGQAIGAEAREAGDQITDCLGCGQFHLFIFRARSAAAHAPSIGAAVLTPRTRWWLRP